MRTVNYKYNIGDTIKFKDKFHPSASCGLKNLEGTTAEVVERVDYNGPCYRIKGHDSFFQERCFAGLVD